MPASAWRGMEAFVEIVLRTKPLTFLNIGPGSGKWGVLFREYTDIRNGRTAPLDWVCRVDGIETCEPCHQEPQRSYYSQIQVADPGTVLDACTSYDIILACDVIERLAKPDAETLIQKLMRRSQKAFIAIIPLGKETADKGRQKISSQAHRPVWNFRDAAALGFNYFKIYNVADERREIGFFVYSPEDLDNVSGLTRLRSSAPIRVVHMSLTPLAGSPIRIVNGLNQFSEVKSRLIVLDPDNYGPRTFEQDLSWDKNKEEALALLRDCDLVHLHHYIDLHSNPFGIDFTDLTRPGTGFVHQFQSTPGFIARRLYGGDRRIVEEMMVSKIPQLVIPHLHERFFPRARVVPQILPIDDDVYTPLEPKSDSPVIVYSPSVDMSAWFSDDAEQRWETKGYPETSRLLERVTRSVPGASYQVVWNQPHATCLAARRHGHIGIDEMVTGSFHLCSLESLSQGLPTFAFLDGRTQQVLTELTGSSRHPWMNFRVEESERALRTLLLDGELRAQIGKESRQWIEKYWDPRDMVHHYVRAYRDILDHPDHFAKPRFDITNRCQMWYIRDSFDVSWKQRAQAGRAESHNIEASAACKTRRTAPAVHGWNADFWSSAEQILLMAKRPVCVVGNAAMKYPFGSIIDSYATVIRMNNYRIDGFEPLVGSKTDYRCVSGWDDVENRNEHVEFSPFAAGARESRQLDRYNARNLRRVVTAAHDIKPYIPEVPNPSTGFALVQLFDMLDIPVDLFGFDGFQTDHYWRNQRVETTHSSREIDYILRRRKVVLYNHYAAPSETRGKTNDGLDLKAILSEAGYLHPDQHVLALGIEDEALIAVLRELENSVTVIEPYGSRLPNLEGVEILRDGVLSLLWEKREFDLFVVGNEMYHISQNDRNILLGQLPRLCRAVFFASLSPHVGTSDSGLRSNHRWWEEKLSNSFDLELQQPEKAHWFLSGRRRNQPSPSTKREMLLPWNFCIKEGYQSRTQADYFEDQSEDLDGITWQPDVYSLAAELGVLAGCSTVIDLGCGHARKLANLHPAYDIVGIDSGSNLQYCRQRYNFGEWIEWDLELPACPPLEEEALSRSILLCADVLEHLIDPSNLLRCIKEWLEHSPIAVLSTPERDRTRGIADFGPPLNSSHVREWNLEELRRLLETAGIGIAYCGLTRSNDQDSLEQTILCILQKNPSPTIADFTEKWLAGMRRYPITVGLFGASSCGSSYLNLLAGNEQFVPFCFFDNNPDKWGSHFHELPIFPPAPVHLKSADVVLVSSVYSSEIQEQLKMLGLVHRTAADLTDLFRRFGKRILTESNPVFCKSVSGASVD